MIGHALAPAEHDAIAGVAPARAFEPGSLDELAEIMRETAAQGQALALVGGGSALGIGRRPVRLDAVIRTRRCAKLVEYAPLDQVITVEAGMTLAELQRITAEHRQRLALDAPQPARATIGGIIAANSFGPLRTRYGTIRDTIVGISIVRADGTRVRGGGKVVKNVAGFDLPRLMVGSLGTLGAIATVTLRLHPLPAAQESLLAHGLPAGEVRALARLIRRLQLEPSAVIALSGADGYDLSVQFEGFAEGVAPQAERLRAAAAEGGVAHFEVATPAQRDALQAAHAGVRSGCAVTLKVSAPPSHFEALDARVIQPLTSALVASTCVWYPLAGCGFISGALPADADAAITALREARAFAEEHEGTLEVQEAPPQLRERFEEWGALPAAFAVMQRLKDRFDPDGRLAPGRFAGGI